MSAQVAADLRAAADVLERDGWTRGAPEDRHGHCCAIGAIGKATNVVGGSRERNAYMAMRDYLKDELLVDGVVTFNDEVATSADEVIAALRAAADRAEAAS